MRIDINLSGTFWWKPSFFTAVRRDFYYGFWLWWAIWIWPDLSKKKKIASP
jgi:hypothetical protein